MRTVAIDFEMLGTKTTAIVVEFSAVFVDLSEKFTFQDLIHDKERSFSMKLKVSGQKEMGRTTTNSTLNWWKNQEYDVRKILIPSEKDVAIPDFLHALKEWADGHETYFKCNGYSRGEIDWFILDSLVEMYAPETIGCLGESKFVVPYWFRDNTRSTLRGIMCDPQLRYLPVHKDKLEGFIKHKSLHDAAKDLVCLQTAYNYAMDVEQIPDKKDCIMA